VITERGEWVAPDHATRPMHGNGGSNQHKFNRGVKLSRCPSEVSPTRSLSCLIVWHALL